jgi:hypothetical protein
VAKIPGWALGNIAGWLLGLLVLLAVVGIFCLLGLTGLRIRKGVELRRCLNKIKADYGQRGFGMKPAWYRDRRKASVRICVPATGWTLLYLIMFLELDLTKFLLSLVMLVPVLMDNFCVFFTIEP